MKNGSVMASTADKIKLANAVLRVRELSTEKMTLLLKSADSWDQASRDTSMTWELRRLNAERARHARAQAGELAKELGL
jgi:hypothetical protein